MNEAQIIDGLRSGKALMVDRKDCPHLPFLMMLEKQGKVTSQLITHGEQSSALRFSWNFNRSKGELK